MRGRWYRRARRQIPDTSGSCRVERGGQSCKAGPWRRGRGRRASRRAGGCRQWPNRRIAPRPDLYWGCNLRARTAWRQARRCLRRFRANAIARKAGRPAPNLRLPMLCLPRWRRLIAGAGVGCAYHELSWCRDCPLRYQVGQQGAVPQETADGGARGTTMLKQRDTPRPVRERPASRVGRCQRKPPRPAGIAFGTGSRSAAAPDRAARPPGRTCP